MAGKWVTDRRTIERTLPQLEWLIEHGLLDNQMKKSFAEAATHMRRFLSLPRDRRRRQGFSADSIRAVDRLYRSMNDDDSEVVQTVPS